MRIVMTKQAPGWPRPGAEASTDWPTAAKLIALGFAELADGQTAGHSFLSHVAAMSPDPEPDKKPKKRKARKRK